MAPAAEHINELSSRYGCNYGYDGYGNCRNYSGWSYWGRWVFTAVLVVVILAVFFLLACIKARRRRRGGAQPMYGTGWMAGNQGNQQYNNPQGYNQAPPPAYGAPQGQAYPMNNQYQTTDGYYGQQSGVQQPKDVHNNPTTANNDYAPPAGPPPGK
ncbi:Uu.00g048710.m01.CDS01 [Anthostomella pinea]|uniref:Uu.00g048710.m01.CDS01 n=1 Tax=Anthostomella pinea TaxID=933095 RepID=A0AAI8VBV3_9PEZI|nr:Uu.00g048710.m01.CDS01 [Anthostomella pinea]